MRPRCHFPGRPLRHRFQAPASPQLLAGVKVGLLGGSFNPAHEGHLHISLEALKRLGLDFVWWLVSPQNPLKSEHGMAPFALRFASAEAAAAHPRIHASDIEARIDTRFTADTLCHITRLYPKTHFVWLMGADNLAQFHRWQRYHEIMRTMPVAVFDRPTYSISALRAKMPTNYAASRANRRQWSRLATAPSPAWAFITCPRHPASATEIRASKARGHADVFL